MPAPIHDPRTSPRNRALLETPSSLAYLPHAMSWALSAEVVLVALPLGAIIGAFTVSWLGPAFLALFGTAALSWLLSLHSHTVDGHGAAPPVTVDDLNIWRSGPRNLVECTGLAFSVYLMLGTLVGADTATGFAYAFGALLPTLFALTALDDGLWLSLHPMRVVRTLRAGGLVGILMAAAFALVVEFSFSVVVEWGRELEAAGIRVLMASWPPSPIWLAIGAGTLWTLAVLAHLHGHALHHHRGTAELDVSLAAPDAVENEARSREAAVLRVARELERASETGDRSLAERVVAIPAPDGVDELLYLSDLWDELLRRKRFPAAVKVARRLVRVAAERKRVAYALEILTEAKRLSPGYEPGAAVRLALARALLASGDAATFERITAVDFNYAGDDDALVELAYLRANWLAEKKDDTAAAIAVLDAVRGREHPLKERIARLREMLVGLPGLEPGTKRFT